MESVIDILKPLQIAYNKKHAGIPLTQEEQDFFYLIEKYLNGDSPKDFALKSNTLDLTLSEITEIINL